MAIQNRLGMTLMPAGVRCRSDRGTGSRGFTLIELMIVVVVVGILASIAYPAYQEQVRKTRRADAQAVLLENAQALERYFSSQNTYVGAILPAPKSPKDGATQFYAVTPTTLTAGTFLITAAPSGAQLGDRCGNLTLTHTGVKGAAQGDCWQR